MSYTSSIFCQSAQVTDLSVLKEVQDCFSFCEAAKILAEGCPERMQLCEETNS